MPEQTNSTSLPVRRRSRVATRPLRGSAPSNRDMMHGSTRWLRSSNATCMRSPRRTRLSFATRPPTATSSPAGPTRCPSRLRLTTDCHVPHWRSTTGDDASPGGGPLIPYSCPFGGPHTRVYEIQRVGTGVERVVNAPRQNGKRRRLPVRRHASATFAAGGPCRLGRGAGMGAGWHRAAVSSGLCLCL